MHAHVSLPPSESQPAAAPAGTQATHEHERLWALSQDLLCVTDLAGRLQSINPAWSETLGWSSHDLLGRSTRWLEHPDDQPGSEHTRQTLARGGKVRRFEHRLRHRDGSYRWIAWSATPGAAFLYGSGRDISGEKHTEQTLHQAEEALATTQQMEALGQFTGGVAHDFNNLLAGIIVSLDLIERRLQPGPRAEVARFLSAASTSAQRGATLTSNLLAFARRQSLDIQPIQINRLIRAMLPSLRAQAGAGVSLHLQLAADPGNTASDAEQLHKAMLHLIDNARDAMPNGGRLEIGSEHVQVSDDTRCADLPPGDYIALSVRDNGCGMDAHTLAHAFDPFFTTKRIGQASGLGLSMVYGFMKQSGGQIRLHSEIDQGTCVTLYFHRGITVPEQEPSSQPDAQASAPQQRILLVEDSDVVRMLTLEVLEELGYNVLEASDAQQALPILQSDERIDLLMTDIGLPGMNGQELAAAARRLRPELKVLFASGYAEIVDIDGSELATQMDMIGKPFSLNDLRDKVQGMLGA